MKKLLFVVFCIAVSVGFTFADKGKVIRENVCGDNIIIETTDGWYIAAEWYGGREFTKDNTVYGRLKTYGFVELTDQYGNEGNYYIEDWESSLEAAYDELCDK